MTLGLESAKYYCTHKVCCAKIYKNTMVFNGFRYQFRVSSFAKCYCDHVVVLDVPEGDALAINLGFNRSRSATAIILGLGFSGSGVHSLSL